MYRNTNFSLTHAETKTYSEHYLSSALLVTRYLVTGKILPQRKSFSPRPGTRGGKFLRFRSESLHQLTSPRRACAGTLEHRDHPARSLRPSLRALNPARSHRPMDESSP